jgi:DNA-binding MurR/RpiR family transcriptional regulator
MHKVEKKIADFIMNNQEKVLSMTVAQIAKHIDVAESSIIRFCQTVGYSGFSEFKVKLAQNSSVSKNPIFEDINSNDDARAITNKVFQVNINTLNDTLNMIDYNNINLAIETISKAKKIILCGVGSSAPIANDCYYRFMRIGLPAYSVTDSNISHISASMLDKDCLAIAISHSGRTREIVNTMKIAKKRNATTMCITSFLNTPLTAVSDIKLVISSTETTLYKEAISSRIAQIAILDSLYVGVALKNQEKVLPLIENMNNILEELRY